ncbi:MAG: envelope stress response membrane protein PspB [Proteobacteria bacterium]|nr:envelope stress response membrane protein PspB [Pseudomonadota bacterium]
MEDVLVPLIAIGGIFVALPWIVLHYVTRWKTAATLTNDDEALLEELYQIARRLDERMDTVERLVAADNPDFRTARIVHDHAADYQPLGENERLRSQDELYASRGRI